MKSSKGLGRGLGSLISSEEIYDAGSPGFFMCPIEKIRPNPAQPRLRIKPESLTGLIQSIKENGILQPLVVCEAGDQYQLVAGERRWRAAQRAGLRNVPVVIKDVSPDELLELALIENIQRQDLNPLEEAMAYKRLVEDLGLTQQEAGIRVGRDRATVANFLRILNLPAYAQEDLLEERLTMGHAKALLMVGDRERQRYLRDEIIRRGLSVRQAESLARKLSNNGPGTQAARQKETDPDIKRLCEDLSLRVGAKVNIIQTKRGGRLEIRYSSNNELERLIELLKGNE